MGAVTLKGAGARKHGYCNNLGGSGLRLTTTRSQWRSSPPLQGKDRD